MRAAGKIAAVLAMSGMMLAATQQWGAASFRGLKLGTAKRDDAVRVLGAPDAVNRNANGEELTYRGKGDHKGELSVKVNRAGVVMEIQEAFPVSIPRTQIYKELGKQAQTAHFSRAKCAGDALYWDARGPIELTMYPERGIALWPDQYGYDFAAVLYLAQKPGLDRAPSCVKKQ